MVAVAWKILSQLNAYIASPALSNSELKWDDFGYIHLAAKVDQNGFFKEKNNGCSWHTCRYEYGDNGVVDKQTSNLLQRKTSAPNGSKDEKAVESLAV